MFGWLYFARLYSYSCQFSGVRRHPTCLQSDLNSGLYDVKRPHHKWSNLLHRAMSRNATLGRVWLDISRPSIQILQLYISWIHSRPVCLLSGQNSRVYDGKRRRHKWSNLPDRAISRSFETCEKSAMSIEISDP